MIEGRVLQHTETVASNGYIVAPTEYEVASGAELDLGTDTELVVS